MFPDFKKLMDMLPRLEEFAHKVVEVVQELRDEQKAQREMLEKLLSDSKGEENVQD